MLRNHFSRSGASKEASGQYCGISNLRYAGFNMSSALVIFSRLRKSQLASFTTTCRKTYVRWPAYALSPSHIRYCLEKGLLQRRSPYMLGNFPVIVEYYV